MDAEGPSAPARDTGLPPGVQVGALGRRFVAYVVDFLIPAAAAGMIAGAMNGGTGGAGVALTVVAVLFVVAWALVCWQQLAIKAASPGMRLMKLQLVGFLDGRPIKWGRVLVRFVVFAVLSATGLGLLLLIASILVSPRHQGWHDRAAGSVVIAERPLAPKRTRIRTRHTGAPSAMQRPKPVSAVSPTENVPAASTPAASTPTASTPAAVPTLAPIAAPLAGDPALPPEPVASPAAEAPAGVNGSRTHRRILEGWVAELDDGREIPVSGLVLLGRNPQPGDGEDAAALVKVPDDSRTVSKTHLALGVDDAGLFVVDRGSTNGSTITAPGQAPVPAAAFRAMPVGEGSVVSIGDHWLRIHRRQS